MLAAAVGKVKAHHDRKNLSFKKFLNIKSISKVKNKVKFSNICATRLNSPVSFISPENASEGGAIKIKSVGINFCASRS